MESAYRDPLAGLRARRAVVDALLRETHPLVWATCAPSEGAEVERLRAIAFDDADGTAANDALGALASMLDGIIARSRERLASSAAVEPDVGMVELLAFEDEQLEPFRERLARALSPWTAAAPVERYDDRRLVARFAAGGVPFALTVRLSDRKDGVSTTAGAPDMKVGGYDCALRTTVPGCLPELALRTERAWHAAQKAVGLVRELQLGDAQFDRAFWIRGDERVARALLLPEVREELFYLSHRSPRLTMAGGALDLAWNGRWGPAAPDDVAPGLTAAVRAIVALRAEIERARASQPRG